MLWLPSFSQHSLFRLLIKSWLVHIPIFFLVHSHLFYSCHSCSRFCFCSHFSQATSGYPLCFAACMVTSWDIRCFYPNFENLLWHTGTLCSWIISILASKSSYWRLHFYIYFDRNMFSFLIRLNSVRKPQWLPLGCVVLYLCAERSNTMRLRYCTVGFNFQ